MLLQLVVMAPLTFALLDTAATKHRPSAWQLVQIPLKNPVTLGSLLGLAVAIVGWQVPALIMAPVTLVGNMAVPAALIAYGVSLHNSPRIGAGGATPELTWVAFCKAVVQPFAAWAVAHFGFGLQGTELLAATMVAALPTAQNVFVPTPSATTAPLRSHAIRSSSPRCCRSPPSSSSRCCWALVCEHSESGHVSVR